MTAGGWLRLKAEQRKDADNNVHREKRSEEENCSDQEEEEKEWEPDKVYNSENKENPKVPS